jgi:hypothetical protein
LRLPCLAWKPSSLAIRSGRCAEPFRSRQVLTVAADPGAAGAPQEEQLPGAAEVVVEEGAGAAVVDVADAADDP